MRSWRVGVIGRGGGSPRAWARGRQARWTIEMVMALYESQLSGGRVHFPLKNRDHPLAR